MLRAVEFVQHVLQRAGRALVGLVVHVAQALAGDRGPARIEGGTGGTVRVGCARIDIERRQQALAPVADARRIERGVTLRDAIGRVDAEEFFRLGADRRLAAPEQVEMLVHGMQGRGILAGIAGHHQVALAEPVAEARIPDRGAADHGGVADQEQLVVHAMRELGQLRARVEDAQRQPGRHLVQGDDQLVLDRVVRLGADAVDQQLDRHAAARGLHQVAQHQAAGLVELEDVGEDADLLGARAARSISAMREGSSWLSSSGAIRSTHWAWACSDPASRPAAMSARLLLVVVMMRRAGAICFADRDGRCVTSSDYRRIVAARSGAHQVPGFNPYTTRSDSARAPWRHTAPCRNA